MLAAGIIDPVDQSEWASPMVVQPNKHDPTKLIICVDLRWLNKVMLTDLFLTPFADEILNEVAGHECYSLTDGLTGYNQVAIAKEDQHKTTFVTEWGCFQYTMMPFGLKNALVIFSRVVVATFKDFIQNFLQVYMDD